MFAIKNIITIALLVAFAEARFGQENAVQNIINAIGGNNGQAATLAGASISTLLAGSNACDKLSLADKVAQLEGAGALDAAKALVQAEKNFNPFVVDRPNICSDPALPATEALRGIIPLIDPAVEGAAAINAASAASLNNPLNADGLSVADLLTAQGFSLFTAQNSNGAVTQPPAANPPPANDDEEEEEVEEPPAQQPPAQQPPAEDEEEVEEPPVVDCPAPDNGNGNNNGGGNANTGDLQTFDGALGAPADPITFSGDEKRPFLVAGNTFVNFAAAAARTCDRQFNACANAANAGATDFEFEDCNVQKTDCQAAQASATVTSFSKRKRSVYIPASRKMRRGLRITA